MSLVKRFLTQIIYIYIYFDSDNYKNYIMYLIKSLSILFKSYNNLKHEMHINLCEKKNLITLFNQLQIYYIFQGNFLRSKSNFI